MKNIAPCPQEREGNSKVWCIHVTLVMHVVVDDGDKEVKAGHQRLYSIELHVTLHKHQRFAPPPQTHGDRKTEIGFGV